MVKCHIAQSQCYLKNSLVVLVRFLYGSTFDDNFLTEAGDSVLNTEKPLIIDHLVSCNIVQGNN